MRDGKLELHGAPLYELPEQISAELVQALFAAQPGDEDFIADVARAMTPASKDKLRLACHAIGGDLWKTYCRNAVRWAALVNSDNVWHLEDFEPVYEAQINAWWAHNVIVTNANIRFVTTPRGLFTFPEFKLTYGKDLIEHIQDYRAARNDELLEIITHITSPLVKKRVTLADDAGRLITREIVVLDSLEQQLWRLPAGTKLMSIDDNG
jgi:hypothetical protein